MSGFEAQKQVRENTREIHEYLKELRDWEKSVKAKDSQLKAHERPSQLKELPPVRKKASQARSESSARHTYDYFRDKWDKFDLDTALREVDDDGERKPSESAMDVDATPSGTSQVFVSPKGAQVSSESLADAASEKELGNQHFKEKKYVQAIECYSRSLALQPTAVAYANRAMALLKIRRFDDAELDCTEAINLDDRYTKAYARRGTARRELEKLLDAVEDFEFALRLEPPNKELQKQYQEAKEAYQKKNAFRPQEQKVQLVVKESKTGFRKAPEQANNRNKEHTKAVTSRAAASAMNSVVQNMVAPRTSYEFETLWRCLSGDQAAKARLLKLLDASSLPKLFKDSLSASQMVDILQTTLESFFPDDVDFAFDILENITKVGRFNVTILFLTAKDKSALRGAWNTAAEGLSAGNWEKLEALRALFNL